MASVAAVVLAGGRSLRFGRNKLAEPMPDGRTILEHAIDAVTAVYADVVVVIAPGMGPSAGPPAALPRGVRVVVDPEPYGGPLVGLVAGLGATASEIVVVVGGDMPDLVPAVLACLGERVGRGSAPAVLLSGSGNRPSLPFAVRRDPALGAARSALAGGDRRLRGLFERLAVDVVPEAEWRLLDPAALTLRDIDRPEDLLAEVVRPNDEYGV